PPPSSGTADDWWNGPGHPNGVFDPSTFDTDDRNSTNPFDSSSSSHPPSMHTSPSTSDDELYKSAIKASRNEPIRDRTMRKPAPPPPSRTTKPSALHMTPNDQI
ncbi:hypothetical protein FS842_002545, partial [Serendipita sp. 407]